jgi:hypothetical protein
VYRAVSFIPPDAVVVVPLRRLAMLASSLAGLCL